MIKLYYQLCLWQLAPLSITNGEGEAADLDLLLDSQGRPFIPGSALTGIMRGMLRSEEERETLFGTMRETTKAQAAYSQESRLIVSDAVLTPGHEAYISVRDGVGLNRRGSAEDGKKFDFQVVETLVPYTAVLELNCEDEQEPAALLLGRLAERLVTEGIRAGQKTSRGYGQLRAELKKRSFDLTCEALEWLDFDPFALSAFDGCEAVSALSFTAEDIVQYSVKLCFTGSFSVRAYSSNVGEADYRPLMSYREPGLPAIPGTSWAGVFRHHMHRLAEQAPDVFSISERDIDALFGVPDEGNVPIKSSIIFSETTVNGGSMLKVTRVALDRFSMAPKTSALFTSEIWQGGSGELQISLPGSTHPVLQALVEACLLDLHNGLLNFGGEGNVGRGCAAIESVTVRRNGVKSHTLLGQSMTGGAV